uniref:Uncharacterized protein n=1 Tax=Panagrolaimus superbus TaxID=310955 RepID=A0A914XX62_9BILA
MLRYCGNLASSSARSLACRTFATTAVRHEDSQPGQNDVDRLFNADSQPRRRNALSINRVELVGGCGDFPVARVSRTGVEYVTFNLFTNIDFRKGDGSSVERVEMHNIHVFGNQANFVKNNLVKGSRVLVIGRLHYEGGTMRPDGTRSPRNASISAETILPINRPGNPNKEDKSI